MNTGQRIEGVQWIHWKHLPKQGDGTFQGEGYTITRAPHPTDPDVKEIIVEHKDPVSREVVATERYYQMP